MTSIITPPVPSGVESSRHTTRPIISNQERGIRPTLFLLHAFHSNPEVTHGNQRIRRTQMARAVYDHTENVPDLTRERVTVYNGFDATADSLHVATWCR